VEPKQAAKRGLDALLSAGADKAQSVLSLSEKHEMNVDAGELSLLRTAFDTRLGLTALKGGRKGQSSINKSDAASIDRAVQDVLAIADASTPDDANDIAGDQPPAVFSAGTESPGLDRMHYRLKELVGGIRATYPRAVFRQGYLAFTRTRSWLVNSNGVDFTSSHGVYHCMAMFSSKDGEKVSSFSYTGFSMRDLEKALLDCASLDTLLRQSGEQTSTTPVQGKFVGDLIVTPDCLDDALGFLLMSIMDGAMISGTSIYKDSLGQTVASPLLTVHSKPVSKEICDGYFVTRDGYAARNSTIVDRGVLKSFLLSLYGANKTGRERAVNDGGAFVVEPGTTSLGDMVKSVKKGLLMARFSGGQPSSSGDFSGIAKNSYLIEDGEVRHSVSESMVSGNFAEMLRSITAVSTERVDFGNGIYPWVAFSGVTVSGK
jgi:PmbA protein